MAPGKWQKFVIVKLKTYTVLILVCARLQVHTYLEVGIFDVKEVI